MKLIIILLVLLYVIVISECDPVSSKKYEFGNEFVYVTATACQAAYSSFDIEKNDPTAITYNKKTKKLDKCDLTFDYHYNNTHEQRKSDGLNTGIVMVTLVSKEAQLAIIAYRGTVSLKNLMRDLDSAGIKFNNQLTPQAAKKEKKEPSWWRKVIEVFMPHLKAARENRDWGEINKDKCKGNPKVMRGWLKAYETLRTPTISYVSRWVKDPNIKHIVITGHSLGGAVASVATLDMGQLFHKEKITDKLRGIWLGSPNIGNKDFVDCFNQYKVKSGQIFIEEDLIRLYPMHFDPVGDRVKLKCGVKGALACHKVDQYRVDIEKFFGKGLCASASAKNQVKKVLKKF